MGKFAYSAPRIFLFIVALTGTTAAAQEADHRVALAVLPLPEADRPTATVFGWDGERLVTVRRGNGKFICLADRPGDERFHAACYHRSLEPYMARGRQLRTEGLTGQANIERRWEEIEAGTLSMPQHPAGMHQLFGPDETAVNQESTEGMSRLTVIYMAYATEEDVGLPPRPTGEMPWLMFPGRPTAHVMISQ